MTKRLSLFLAVLVLLLAAGRQVQGAGGIRLDLSQAQGRVGEEVSLTLVVQDNPGIISLQLQLAYDDTKLRLVSVTDGGILGEEIHHQEEKSSPYTLSWENYTAKQNFVENGVLCTLNFRILDGEEGEVLPVKLSAGDYGVMNYTLADLPRTLTDGSITVTGRASSVGFVLPWVAAGICLLTPLGYVAATQGKKKKDSKKERTKA